MTSSRQETGTMRSRAEAGTMSSTETPATATVAIDSDVDTAVGSGPETRSSAEPSERLLIAK